MIAVIGELLTRAESAGAALIICDAQDRIVVSNRRMHEFYPFVEFSSHPTFEQYLWRNIETRNTFDPAVYDDPYGWIQMSNKFRNNNLYAQFLTRHSNGRVLLVCHERLRNGTDNFWYQARVDVSDQLSRAASGEMPDVISLAGRFAALAGGAVMPVAQVLEGLPTAAVVLEHRGQVVDANRAFRALAQRRDGLGLADNHLIACNGIDQSRFRDWLARVFRRDVESLSHVLPISRGYGKTPYLLRVSLAHSLRDIYIGCDPILISVVDRDKRPMIAAPMLAELLRLTEAEAEIAIMISNGNSLKEIAIHRGVSHQTVSCQVKSILAKTGYRGQVDIARSVTDLSWSLSNRM